MTAATPSVALCGAGLISQAHAAAARFAGYPLIAVASRSVERAQTQATNLGTTAVSYDQLPFGAEIVVVATPPQCHADDAIRLLDAGAAVLLEKPLCRTLDEADRIVAAAARHGERLLYAENLAYAPIVQRLLVEAGTLGPLTHLQARTVQSLPTWGAFTSDEWGGGALFDLGVHPLAIVILVASANGAGRATSVSASLRGGEGHNSDEHAEVSITFQSGLVATVTSSWQGGEVAEWDVQAASETGVLRAELSPEFGLERNGEAVPLPEPTTAVALIDRMGYLGQLTALAEAVATGERPVMSARFGAAVLDIVCAAYWSAGRDSANVSLPFSGPRDMTPLQLWHHD